METDDFMMCFAPLFALPRGFGSHFSRSGAGMEGGWWKEARGGLGAKILPSPPRVPRKAP
jgi:hypothetical protein